MRAGVGVGVGDCESGVGKGGRDCESGVGMGDDCESGGVYERVCLWERGWVWEEVIVTAGVGMGGGDCESGGGYGRR